MTAAAFFDLDKTVISRSSVFAVAFPIYKEGLLNRRVMMRGIYRQILYSLFGADEDTMEAARQGMLDITRGWEKERIRQITEDAIESVISPIVYEGALELIDKHKRDGDMVFIVSTSPEEIVLPLARFLGVENVVATRAQISDGRYTGELEFYSYGPYKAERIGELAVEHDLDLKASYAYSDSITDLPMLEAVGHPNAVNPDRALRRVAGERGWTVLDFQRRVVLRRRIPTPPLKPTLAICAALGATIAFAAWYRARYEEIPGLEQALIGLKLIRPRPVGPANPQRARAGNLLRLDLLRRPLRPVSTDLVRARHRLSGLARALSARDQ